MIVVVGLLVYGGQDDGLSRRKSRIGAGIPTPNDDVTMPVGAKMLTGAVFRDTGLDELPGDDRHLGEQNRFHPGESGRP